MISNGGIYMDSLGNRLRIAREKKGYSQTEVFRRTNINNKTLSRYEKNGSEPDRQTLITLANLYDVHLEWLMTGEKPSVIKNNNEEHLNDDYHKIERFARKVSNKDLKKAVSILEAAFEDAFDEDDEEDDI